MYYPYVLKELRHRHNRTMVNVFGIAVGIALFISINAVSTAYKNAASQPFKDIGADLVVQRSEDQQALPDKGPKSMRGIRLPFSNQVFRMKDLAALKRLEGIDATAHTLLLWEFSKNGFRTIMGVDARQPALGALKARDWVQKGRFPEKPGEIALEKHFAKFRKTQLGDVFQISGHPFTVVGTIGIKEGAQVTAANIYMSLDDAQNLLGKNPDAVNLIYLRLKNPSMVNRVKSELSTEIKGASISSSDSFLELMGGVSMISERFSLIASMVGLLGAALLIIKTMLSNIVERSHEIGILKAVGWTQKEIQKQLMAEAFVQTLAGGLLGILMGYLISYFLGFLSISIPVPWELNPVPAMARQVQAASQVVRLPVAVSLSLAATAMLLSVITGCITGYVLGLRTAKMKPTDIFREL
ncbi:MAG: ABC transporter permease [Deltaproteobacteria bacterium]|jgi:putative ABC transport system permease protein|nr:ABC transporter permease [Deltaproteobacteria bacterium]MBT7715225.1 ABC transporter permease [Deltaproteobacteria bacterium]